MNEFLLKFIKLTTHIYKELDNSPNHLHIPCLDFNDTLFENSLIILNIIDNLKEFFKHLVNKIRMKGY